MMINDISPSALHSQNALQRGAAEEDLLTSFESMLWQQMVQEMNLGQGLGGEGFAQDMLMSVFEQQLAQELAEQVDLGLRDQLKDGLARENSAT